MPIDIDIADPRWPDLIDLTECVEKAARAGRAGALGTESSMPLAIRLSNDEEVQRLNRTFRDKDVATNVLSFPGPSEEGIGQFPEERSLGDIILALETVQREAEIDGKKFESHVAHLVVHGVLHLAGFDHEEPDAAEEMESLEIEILQRLGIENPYV